MHIIGDDGDDEILCEHGVGHSYHVHTCDGCCLGNVDLILKMQKELACPECGKKGFHKMDCSKADK